MTLAAALGGLVAFLAVAEVLVALAVREAREVPAERTAMVR